MKHARILLAVSSVAGLLTSPALASEEGGKAGLPQLDPTPFVGEWFWLAVTFATLYVVLRYFALPGLQETQAKRQGLLSGDIDAAKASEAETQQLKAGYEKRIGGRAQ